MGEAVGYLSCAESDVKQPSDSLAGASRRPSDDRSVGNGLIGDGGLGTERSLCRQQ